MKSALIPGSFDPMTLGHLDLIRRARGLFDTVTVVIMVNEDKKGYFTFAQRKTIAELTVGDMPGVTVITAGGYLADLASALGADAIVKGVRNADDFIYEQRMAVFNHERNPHTETLYLPAYGDMTEISSTSARRALADGSDTSMYIAPAAALYISTLGRKTDGNTANEH